MTTAEIVPEIPNTATVLWVEVCAARPLATPTARALSARFPDASSSAAAAIRAGTVPPGKALLCRAGWTGRDDVWLAYLVTSSGGEVSIRIGEEFRLQWAAMTDLEAQARLLAPKAGRRLIFLRPAADTVRPRSLWTAAGRAV